MRSSLPIALALLASAGLSSIAGAQSTEPTNLALGKRCVAYPRMGGNPHTDNGKESAKLTDGKRSPKVLWEDKEHTVGWRDAQWPVQVIVDLGQRQPISGVSVGMGAGVALSSKEIFAWPGLIDVFVSDDQKLWHPVGELISLHEHENEPLPAFDGVYDYRKVSTRRLETAGRYIRLVFSPRKEVFLDEIEVFGGDRGLLDATPSQPGIGGEKIEKFVERPDSTLIVAKRRYRMDIHTIEGQLEGLKESDAKPIREALAALKNQVEMLEEPPADKRAVLPVGDIGRAILAQQAAVWRALGKPPVIVWQSGVWDHLEWLAAPPAEEKLGLKISLIRNERRSTSFNLTNTTDREQTFTVSIEGLPGGSNPGNVEVRSVEWTESFLRTAIAYALPSAEKTAAGYEVKVPAGMTRQVLLTVEGKGEAGTFQGNIAIVPAEKGLGERKLPLELKLYPFDFPEKQALHFSGWDYLTEWEKGRYGFRPETARPAVKLLKDYRMDLVWAPGNIWPKGKFNAVQEYASQSDEPDVAKFNTWVKEIWPGAHRYMINISGRNKDNKARIDGVLHEKDPAAFDKRVATWLQFWEKYVKSIGMDPQQFSLLIIDEPGLAEDNPYKEDESIKAWVEAIQKSGTNFRMWMDPVYQEPWNAYQPSIDAMDELCIKHAHVLGYGEKFVNYFKGRSEKQEMRLYECYPIVGGFDPYSYYRLQAWTAWAMNANGIGFWSVGDSGRNPSHGSWNNGLNPLHYSPLFLDDTSVIPGKPMEGIREGISDYQYLVMLRDAISAAEKKGADAAKIGKAKQLVTEAPERVLWKSGAFKEPKWLATTRIDRNIADEVRVEILEEISSLSEASR